VPRGANALAARIGALSRLRRRRPGVFAIGDVRAGNLKRVASAVGEGAIAVHLLRHVLHE